MNKAESLPLRAYILVLEVVSGDRETHSKASDSGNRVNVIKGKESII